uniref:TAXI family TRAP transporter solute-binding subunit n=1 Tax=Candidatus Entotheonella palauensis TaxID=93172 RepID=UPI000B7E7AA2
GGGGAIARLVNANRQVHNLRVAVESTPGSVYNVNALMAGELEFGIAQSDRQYQAWHGLAEWQTKGPQQQLRSLFSIHSESITLVASEPSGIRSLDGLLGKRINIGDLGSGHRQNAMDVLNTLALHRQDAVHTEGAKADTAPARLQDGKIDAFFYTAGHPSGTIKEATSGDVKIRFIPLIGPGIDALLKKFPYYVASSIPISFYPHVANETDVTTLGIKATLVTSARVPEEVVYAVVKEVFDNFEQFKTLHPAFALLTKEHMLQGLTAPLHSGALKYYQEAGLR